MKLTTLLLGMAIAFATSPALAGSAEAGPGRDAAVHYRSGNVADWAVFVRHDRFVGVSPKAVGADVTTPAGSFVGSIDAVDAAGRVAVRTGDDRVIWADAENFRFDPEEDAVYTDLSREQFFALAP